MVEFVTRRFLTNVSMNKISSEFVKSHNVRNRLGARLDTELNTVISNREMLPIYSSNRDRELIGVNLS
jgi:hypothetical protein